ncbi:hypothetical protein ACIBI9_64270 [Nonomuraea sp. NPDC050451]|uniref:hypothetical protein n=1 Tax=Nonomuraea sp. NPDC050451 TaxID=3364364 RepID=UPI0037B40D8D
MIVGQRVWADVVTVSPWRELDGAISEAGRGDGPAHAHSRLRRYHSPGGPPRVA